MVEAMSHLPDDAPFRWYQDSVVVPSRGWHQATDALVVTMGQVRKELGVLQPQGRTWRDLFKEDPPGSPLGLLDSLLEKIGGINDECPHEDTSARLEELIDAGLDLLEEFMTGRG